MKLYYFQDPDGNFGDDMNAWIWDALLPNWRNWRDDTTVIGIGTILNTQLPLPSGRKLVLGSGTGYGNLPDISDPEEWDVRAVRGQKSAERLRLPLERGIVDPAMMLPTLAEFQDIPQSDTSILIPHCSNTERHNWERVCARSGLRYVSPRGEAKSVIREIAAAPLVLAESMHAAIVADAFRTPWVAISISGTLNRPKWLDWSESVGVDLTVHELFPEFSAAIQKVRRIKRRLKGQPPPAGQVSTGQGAAADVMVKPAAATAAGPDLVKSLQLEIRHKMERFGIASRLRQALEQPASLSQDATLAARQQAFRTMLDAVQADYGP